MERSCKLCWRTIVASKPKDGTTAEPAENDPAWKKIHPLTEGNSFYRKPPSDHIVHNKFLIYADKNNRPKAVLFGSTNWTSTGLCAQTNNTAVIVDDNVAARYLSYSKTLKADEQAVEANKGKFQGTPMRGFDSTGKQITLDKGDKNSESTLTSYFSPNTPSARSSAKKKTGNEMMPVDMKDLSARVMAAKHAVLFLAFIPGTPSITEFAAAAQKANKDLFVRGCVTSPDAAGNFRYDLKGTSPPKTKLMKGQKKAPPQQDPRVIAATALAKGSVPEGWKPELLKAGFAITTRLW